MHEKRQYGIRITTTTRASPSPPRAYGWLLLDIMEGDQTLFTREDWIDQAWSIVDPLVSRLASHPPKGFPNYAAGSRGPEAAAELLARDGRHWKPG